MELSQNGISHSQQPLTRDNGLTNPTHSRKQEYEFYSTGFTTRILLPTSVMSNLLNSVPTLKQLHFAGKKFSRFS